jgi:hypothetical protein
MLEHPEKCIDPRGEDHLSFIFEWLGQLMHCDSPEKGLMMFRAIMFSLDMSQPQSKNREEELDILTQSVNPERLRNNPVKLDEKTIYAIYDRILK